MLISPKRLVTFLLTILLFSFSSTPFSDPWVKTYDLSGADEFPLGIDATSDNGFVFSGVTDNTSTQDLWVVKLNADGTLGWERTYDSQVSGWHTKARSIEQLSDNSFVVGAEIDNNLADHMILKLNSTGTVQWSHYYGDLNNNQGGTVKSTSDGGYISVGTSPSGVPDWGMRVIKTDSSGIKQWENLYYNTGTFNCVEIANSVDEISTGGFVLAGTMLDCTAWILKINSTGVVQWQKSYPNATYARSIKETADGGFIVCGYDSADVWIAKLDSAGNVTWEKTLGGTFADEAYSVIELSTGGFIFSGKYGTASSNTIFDTWIVKLDSGGNIVWQKRFDGEEGFGVTEAVNGDIGVITEVSATVCILRLDSNGEVGVCTTLQDTAVTPVTPADTSAVTTASTLAFSLSDNTLTINTVSSSATETELCYPCDTNITASLDSITPGSTVCEGIELTFTGSGTGEGTLTYDWDFDYSGVFSSDLSENPAGYTYPAAGTYTVALKVTDSCPYPSDQSAIDTADITILPGQPIITGPADSCPGDPVILDAGTGFSTYSWTPGGATSQTINPSPAVTTVYTVNTLHPNGCPGSDDHTVTIHQPTPTITGLSVICSGDNAVLDAGAGYSAYLWSPGGQTTQTIDASPIVTTLYSVTVTDGFGCEGMDNHDLTVNDVPQSAPTILTWPTDVCLGEEYTITWSAVPGATYYHVDELCNDVTAATVNEFYTTTKWAEGDYCYRVRAMNDCGAGIYSTTINVTVHPDPAPVITGDTETCQGDPVDLDAGAGFTDYLWSPGGQTTQTINQYIGSSTNFTVTVHDASGCEGMDSHFVTYYPAPTPTITGPSEICEGDPPVTLDAGAGYVSYLWSPGGETTQTIDVSPAVTTMYEVTVSDGNICLGNSTKWLSVNPAPTTPAIAESCYFNDIILDSGPGYNRYFWNTGNTTRTLNIGNDTTSLYTVTVYDELGCSSQDSYNASGPCVAAKDIYEEDDICFTSATVIHDGETQSHDFQDDFNDWISFSACSGRNYTIETSSLGTLCDTVLELYGPDCGSLLTSDDNSGTGSASLINWAAPANGVYHIKVLQADSTTGTGRTYDIALTGSTHSCSSWGKSYGSSNDEYAKDVVASTDGGYLLAGTTASFGSGSTDGWLVKVDEAGSIEWEKVYGDFEWDQFDSAIQTSDGGYLLTGSTASWGGGSYDIWIVKIEASGNITWENTYGDGGYDVARETKETSDGGFIVAAGSRILKLNSNGTIGWQKNISSGDYRTVAELSDGGFITASSTNGYLLKLTSTGSINWQKTFNSSYQISFRSISSTSDGGFITSGAERPAGPSDFDFWAAKMDSFGTVEWQKSYGTESDETVHSVNQTSDGGYILTGFRDDGNPFDGHIWTVKLDPSGNIDWQKLYSGNVTYDGLMAVEQTADEGFLVAGNTSLYGAGGYDLWALKLYEYGDISASCPFVSDTAVSGVDTAASITFPSLTASDTALSPSPTTAIVVVTSAAIDTQCSGTCEPALAVIESISPASEVCMGTVVDFKGSAAGETPIIYEWDFDYDGISFSTMDSGSAVSYTYTVAGTYTVALKVTDSCSSPGEDTAVTTITVFDSPTAAPANSGPDCAGTTISFTSNPSGGSSPYIFNWDFGDGTGASTLANPSYTYASPGNYNANCTVTDVNGCESGAEITVATVRQNPTVVPSHDGPECAGSAINFTANPSGGTSPYSFVWDFGDGSGSSSLRDPAYTYTSSGVFTPSCTVTDAEGCQSSSTAPDLTVNESPSAVLSDSGPVCSGNTIAFTASPSGGTSPYSFSWNFGDGSGASTLQNPSYTYAGSGIYTAECMVTDSIGCTSTVPLTGVTIYENPSASPSNNGPGCVGSVINFAANPSGGSFPYTYNWDFGDGSGASTLENPTYSYSAAGIYTVSLAVSDNNACGNVLTHPAVVGNSPSLPGNFTVTVACGAIELNWTDSLYETSYRIERDQGTGFELLFTPPADTTSHSDVTAADGIDYTYRVRAENNCGASSFTNELSAKTATGIYSAPVISNDGEYCNALVIGWIDTFGAETGYVIERNVNSGGWLPLDVCPADIEYYADHDVSEGNNYDYRIMVSNICGNSGYSNTVSMTPDCTVTGGTTCPNPVVFSGGENISNAPSWVVSNGIAWNGNHYCIVWPDNRDGGVWKTIFAKMDIDGNLVPGSEKIIGSAEIEYVDIAWNGSQFGVAAFGDIACGEGGFQIYFFTLDIDGNLTSSQVDLTCGYWYGNNMYPKVHWNGSTWGVVWESWAWDEQEVFFQRLDTSAIKLHTDPVWISSSGPSYYSGNPDITSLGNEWYIVWEQEDGSDQEIWYSRRNADGSEIATGQLTNDSSWNWMVRASANDSMIGLIWEVDTEPYFRALNPDGSWGSAVVQLASTPDGRDTDIASTGTEWGAIWREADIYDDPSDTFFQRIDSTGTPVGSPLNVTNDFWDSWVPRIARGDDRWGLAYTANPFWGNSDVNGAIVACGASSAPPSAPLNVDIEEFCEVILLHWIDTSANEDGFIIERSVDGGGYSTVATLSADSYYYLDTLVVPASVYSYRVTARNTDGDGTGESETGSPLPCSITDLILNSVVKNPDGTIDLEWEGVSWHIDIDVYRGELNEIFTYNHDTQIECRYDAETGILTTASDQITAQPDYYYIIAPNTTDTELYGTDSLGNDRPVSGNTCP